MLAVHLLRAKQQIGKRQFEQIFNFSHTPALRNSGLFGELFDGADKFDSLCIHFWVFILG